MTDQTAHTQNNSNLMLYNSLTRTKEVFTPIDPKRVTMYNCGPTVYSYAHIGNARAAVVADVLFRVLRHIYGEEHVVYARNITDVDDKIIAAAKEQGVDISDITEKYARIYNEDLDALGCLPPTHQPKATAHIDDMIVMISKLITDGFAYESEGHVFFEVSKFDEYGKLSGNTLEALRGGDRVGEGEIARKKNPADFVLWKPELDGVGWDAPFGRGRPGWHIECSAMSKAVLCETIDIHCGGVDLKFPHHENEIAQSECAHGQVMANYWVHNEFLNMGSEKMSKSIGNVKLIHDLRKDWDGEVIRLALLKAHYRSELVWSEDLLKESKTQLDGWYRLISEYGKKFTADMEDQFIHKKGFEERIMRPLFDDMNSLSILRDIAILEQGIPKGLGRKVHRDGFSPAIRNLGEWPNLGGISFILGVLGLLQKDPEEWFKGGTSDDEEADINTLIIERDAAKSAAIAAKKAGDKAAMGVNFKRSDEIRDTLKARGIVLEDGADGTTWRRA